MKADAAAEKRTQQTQGVESLLLQVLFVANIPDSDSIAVIAPELIEKLAFYIAETEVPILSEFCVEIGFHEDVLLNEFLHKYPKLKTFIKILENKKRAALERKIYSGELNATISSQLMKRWSEEPPTVTRPEYRDLVLEDLDKLELQADELATIFNLLHSVEIKIPFNAEIKKFSRSVEEQQARKLRC